MTVVNPGSGPSPNLANRLDGRVWALIAASSLGLNTTLASLAYGLGATPLLIAAVRALVAACILGLWLRSRGMPAFHPRDWKALFVATVATTGVSVGYLGSVFFIPVSLAAIIFYTFPLVVAGVNALIERRMPTVGESGLFLLAFVGLILAIGPSFQALDWRGIALAGLASTSSATLFIVAARRLGHINDLAVSFQINLFGGCVVALGALALFPSMLTLPGNVTGGALIGAICLAYLVGVTTLFTAVKQAGPAKTALFFNIEPLVSIALAFVLLGERLSGPQLLGGACVVTALMLGSLQRVHKPVPPTI